MSWRGCAQVREMGITEHPPVASNAPAPHKDSVTEQTFNESFATHYCLRCGHSWTERTRVEW